MRVSQIREQADIVLPTTADAPRHARAFVRTALARWQWAGIDRAVLAVSEAVAESVLTADSARVAVSVQLLGDRSLQLRVQDDDPTPATDSPRHSDYTRRVIADLSEDWGVDLLADGEGKVTWMLLADG